MKKFIPKFVFSVYHYLLALMGAAFYNFPSRKLIVVGVTGTKGKSTVVHIAHEILNNVASISSIRFKINDKEEKNMLKMTMPGRFKIQKFLKQAIKANCKYVILEVTSEGIKQFRHKFIQFNGVVFTNLAKEHIEAHGGFENYKKAKGKLFIALRKSRKKNKFLVMNVDDKYSEYYSKLAGDVKKYPYTFENIETSLIGDFNKYNALAALNVGLALGFKKQELKIKDVKGLPGRMELVASNVYIDYAHTPDSLEAVYKTLGKNLICVLGSCGGGRDKWKRPEMGKIASQYCDKIILTNEDPYHEDPEKILDDIGKGIKKDFEKILDRRKAIKKALSLRKNHTVIITGKGSEPWMVIKDKKVPWDEKEVVKQELNDII